MTSLLIILAISAGLIAAIVLENRRKRLRTVDEFESDVRSGRGLLNASMRAAMLEVDRCLKPSVQIVAETLDEQKRQSESDAEGDDPDRIARWRGRRAGGAH